MGVMVGLITLARDWTEFGVEDLGKQLNGGGEDQEDDVEVETLSSCSFGG